MLGLVGLTRYLIGCLRDNVKGNEVIALHKLKVPVCEHQVGQLSGVLAVHLKCQRILLDQLRDSFQEKNEAWAYFLLWLIFLCLGCKEIAVSKHACSYVVA